MVIYYTALPFVRLENGGLAPGEAVEYPHSSAVIRRADAMLRNEANAGAGGVGAYRKSRSWRVRRSRNPQDIRRGAARFRLRLRMTTRKGELTPATIDRGWPYQVALPADRVTGANNAVIHEFCGSYPFVRATIRSSGMMSLTLSFVSLSRRTLRFFAKGSAASLSIRRIAAAAGPGSSGARAERGSGA